MHLFLLFLLLLLLLLFILDYLLFLGFPSIRCLLSIGVLSITHYLVQQVALDLLHRLHSRLRIEEYQVKYCNQAGTAYITKDEGAVPGLIALGVACLVLFVPGVGVVEGGVRVQDWLGLCHVSPPLEVKALLYSV